MSHQYTSMGGILAPFPEHRQNSLRDTTIETGPIPPGWNGIWDSNSTLWRWFHAQAKIVLDIHPLKQAKCMIGEQQAPGRNYDGTSTFGLSSTNGHYPKDEHVYR
jgi:hypothetical protein